MNRQQHSKGKVRKFFVRFSRNNNICKIFHGEQVVELNEFKADLPYYKKYRWQ